MSVDTQQKIKMWEFKICGTQSVLYDLSPICSDICVKGQIKVDKIVMSQSVLMLT